MFVDNFLEDLRQSGKQRNWSVIAFVLGVTFLEYWDNISSFSNIGEYSM